MVEFNGHGSVGVDGQSRANPDPATVPDLADERLRTQNSTGAKTSSMTTAGPAGAPDGSRIRDEARWEPVLSPDGRWGWDGFSWVAIPWPPGTPDADPVPYGSTDRPAPRPNRLALASMICGCGIVGFGLLLLCRAGFVGGVPALIMGFNARRQIKHSGGMQGGSWMALTGMITGAVVTSLSVLFWSFAFLGLGQ